MNDLKFGRDPAQRAAVVAIITLACAAPALLAHNLPPSPTLLNQCLALALWGAVVLVLPPTLASGTRVLLTALGLLIASALASCLWGTLPAAISLSAAAVLAASMVVSHAGGASARRYDASYIFAAFAIGLAVAGVASALVACVQVFAPGWADGEWIAHSGLVGRAVGNLRQSNHLCSLLLWAAIAVITLLELGWLRRAWAGTLIVVLVFAVELSASRTGAAGLLLLALWGLLDRRLSPTARTYLLLTPVMYGLSYAAMLGWGWFSDQAVGAGARLAVESTGIDSPNSRSRIWANTLELIRQQPWTGVGFGEFNAAWSLTPFPGRPTAFFDHTHTLPLQLAVELGLPLAAVVLALLGWALWLAWRRARSVTGPLSTAATAAWMIVSMIGMHSMVEYPLWYAYFLLPTAFAWGFALGVPASGSAVKKLPLPAAWAGRWVGTVLVAGGVAATLDYMRIVEIYAPNESSAPLSARIEIGQQSVFFAQHADYAAATSSETLPGRALAFARAPHYLLDTRLMMAWAKYLAERGEIDKARALAERLREFRNPDSASFFAECESGETTAFQCQKPQSSYSWRSYLVTTR